VKTTTPNSSSVTMMMKMPLGKPPAPPSSSSAYNSTEAIITNKLQSLLDTSAFSPPPKPTRLNVNTTNLSLDNLSSSDNNNKNKTNNTLKKNQHIIMNNYEQQHQHETSEHFNKNQYSPSNNRTTLTAYKRSPSVGNSKSDFKYFTNNVIFLFLALIN
jgi:hypothetical protein